jgi:hypothetical protein
MQLASQAALGDTWEESDVRKALKSGVESDRLSQVFLNLSSRNIQPNKSRWKSKGPPKSQSVAQPKKKISIIPRSKVFKIRKKNLIF